MASIKLDLFKETCSNIATGFPDDSTWQGDKRFGAALVVIEKDNEESTRTLLADQFQNQYNSKTIKKASKTEKKMIKVFSGMQPGQELFSSVENEVILFAAWWPWSNGTSVSLRVGMFTFDEDIISDDEIMTHLSEWFSIKK